MAASDVPCSAHQTLEQAVSEAHGRTPRGGTLLFSPSCASFDAFVNFRARAEAFHAALVATESPDRGV